MAAQVGEQPCGVAGFLSAIVFRPGAKLMKSIKATRILSPIVAVLCLFSGGFAPRSEAVNSSDYVSGEVLVKFRRGTQKRSQILSRVRAQSVKEFSAVGWEQLRIPAETDLSVALATLRQFPEVEAAQPNFIYRTQAVPNDPRYAEQVGLKNTGQIGGTPGADIDAEPAWDITTGNAAVVVAVLDLGVDYNHEDLSANMWRNPGETGQDSNGANKATNNIDDDANGYVDDVYGIDTRNHDSNPLDDNGHGTHVAGTIGAVGNNGVGVTGVNWSVRIMALKTHDAAGNGTSASVIEGFQYAAMMRQRGINVRITNSSWGGAPEAPSFDQALKDAIDLAGSADILNVCAAGNGNSNNDSNPFYPASYNSESILSVAASDQADDRAIFSNYGMTSVDLAAPGVGILSTRPNNAYGYLSGTSMAAPHASGVAALLVAKNSLLNRTTLKQYLMNGTEPLPASWQTTPVATNGRVNAIRALQAIPTTNPIDTATVFVRQHYLDFLNREPDSGGQSYWTNEITTCGANAMCVHQRRIGVSGAFFVESEFQETGSFVYRMYKASFGRVPTFAEFQADRGQIMFGPNLENQKNAFAANWVQRPDFLQMYPNSLSNEDFVNRLFDMAQLFPFTADRQSQIEALRVGGTRAAVVRYVIEIAQFRQREYNPSFVLMQYFGYLRRDPEPGGFAFWLDVVNNRAPNNYPAMICAFLTSAEYQLRFAPVVSRTNAECAN